MLPPTVYLLNPSENLPAGLESLESPDAENVLASIGLTQEVIDRARSFASAKRVHEYLWGRTLLAAVVKSLSASGAISLTSRERPPLSPVLAAPDGTPAAAASITHTAGTIAVMVSETPAAIDAEVINPGRVREALVDHVFGDGVNAMLQKRATDPVLSFYALWGLHEAAVKLEGKFLLSLGKSGALAFSVQIKDKEVPSARCCFARLAVQTGKAGNDVLLTILDCDDRKEQQPDVALLRARLAADNSGVDFFEPLASVTLKPLEALERLETFNAPLCLFAP